MRLELRDGGVYGEFSATWVPTPSCSSAVAAASAWAAFDEALAREAGSLTRA